ncbi:MAG: hypothetical protein K6D93_02725, partial [Saccharofermentans sp.]|nr:hypothetical protein [Saccharofermentans sp.]
MKKIKAFAIAMAVIMLMPMLMSCSPVRKKATVVKADDPWYESVRFNLDPAPQAAGAVMYSGLCASDDKLFSLYNYTTNAWGSSHTILDVFDLNGNLLNRKEVTCPNDLCTLAIHSISAGPEGKTLNAIIGYLGENSGGPMFTSIDTETGKMTNIKEIKTKKVKRLVKKGSTVHDLIYAVEKEGCRKFLNYLFAGTAYDSGEPGFRQIVTNKEIMERNIAAVTKYN